ncbi:MAG: hypothetical protein CSB48_12235 [Proteobacteria bacterium]|nr:MAG: hypothetical protein CSB48_12235 [Pseudomonadota bacterium]
MLKNKVLLAVAVLASSAAIADGEPDRFYISGGWNKFLYDSDRFIKDQNDVYLGMGYHFNPQTAVELMVNRGNTTDRASLGNETDVTLASLNLVQRMTPVGESGLFGRLGVGFDKMTPKTDHIKKEAAGRLGFGYEYHVTDYMALTAAMDVVYGIETEMADFIPSAGITLFFGASAPAPVPVAPAPVEVYKDTDGDGIADNNDVCPNTPAGDEVDAKGCSLPKDADGDGVLDKDDACPNTPAGDAVDAKGCSLPKDADGDGVVDSRDDCPDTAAGARVDEHGCALVLTEVVEIDLYVSFGLNSSKLSSSDRKAVADVAAFLKAYPDTQCHLAGYTDSTGPAAYNLVLSKKRAEAVKRYLVEEFGVSADRVSAEGFGESQPVADNSTKAGQAKNRRVTATIKATVNKYQ